MCYFAFILGHVRLLFVSVRPLFFFIFFFQAEDGIRDWSVTGVQTCALPISRLVLGPASLPLCARRERTKAPEPAREAGPRTSRGRQKPGWRQGMEKREEEIGRASCRERV